MTKDSFVCILLNISIYILFARNWIVLIIAISHWLDYLHTVEFISIIAVDTIHSI